MYYVGIDYHKRYSMVSAVDEQGVLVREARLANTPEALQGYLEALGGPAKAVLEACGNWGYLYDLLVELEGIEELVLAHPGKTRLIAEAQIKTDRLDGRALAQLLRANLIPRAYVPTDAVRRQKHVLRQRLFWLRLRTMVRNRIHVVLERQRGLSPPQVSDLFGKKGRHWLQGLTLPAPDGELLRQDLTVLGVLDEQVRTLEREVALWVCDNPHSQRLLSVPGIGPILGAVIAAEIDDPARFPRSEKLCAYAGLVPTTYASGGKEYHGHLLPFCNKWLRWAFTEAAWVAVGCSEYFGGLYRHHRVRGKAAHTAIMIVARRLGQIVWHVLQEQREHREQGFTPGGSHLGVASSAAGERLGSE